MPTISTMTLSGGGDLAPLFGPALRAAIDRAVAQLPPDTRIGVRLRVTIQGVEAEAAVRLARGLEFAAYAQATGGTKTVGAELRFTR